MSSALLFSLSFVMLSQAPYDVVSDADAPQPAAGQLASTAQVDEDAPATASSTEQAVPRVALAPAPAAADDDDGCCDGGGAAPVAPLVVMGVGAMGFVGAVGLYAYATAQAQSLTNSVDINRPVQTGVITQVKYGQQVEAIEVTYLTAFGLAGLSLATATVGTVWLGAELLQE